MRLVYTNGPKKGQLVKVGDRADMSSGEQVIVRSFREPHKPASEGHVAVKFPGAKMERMYYVSVIGAEWIEREDRN